MLSRAAVRLTRPTAFRAGGVPIRLALQARFQSQQAVDGSKGRKMPVQQNRATAPAGDVEATFTIRVGRPLLFPSVHR